MDVKANEDQSSSLPEWNFVKDDGKPEMKDNPDLAPEQVMLTLFPPRYGW